MNDTTTPQRVKTADLGDGVRLITLDNPPVNALGYALCGDLVPLVEAADKDASVSTVIFTGANGMFSGGADVNDFTTPPTAETKTVRSVIEAVERSDKTFVAAIDGNALGGGFELALACDYRVATAKSRVGLPEIKLGLLPGAGGTQRLPRLIGANDALQMMLKGEMVKAPDALAKKILDEVVDADAVGAAKKYAGKPKRRISERKAELGVANLGLFATPFVVAQAHMMVPAEENGGYAAHKLIDAVQAAIELPFERGWARELRLFMELVQSKPSAALRHVFFAERELAKVPGLPKTEPLEIKKAGVIGAGTMGTGIAIVFAEAGIPVTVIDTNDDAVGQVDIVVEAVFESMPVKKDVFAKLDAATKPEAILASNTSTLDIDEIASATKRPDKVLGLHFFAPANIMKLLEVVRGKATSPQTLTTGIALGKKLRKVAVVSGNAFGFIGNRMLFEYEAQAVQLAEEGVSPARIDHVIKEKFGFAMGPFAVADLSGLDVYHFISQSQHGQPLGRIPVIAKLVEQKRLGQKSGAGFFKYDKAVGKGRQPIPDPEVEQLIAQLAKEAGIAQNPNVSDEEIIARCTRALADSGAELVRTGVALRPGDVDIVWIYGYGFPPHHGGPMWYAEHEAALRQAQGDGTPKGGASATHTKTKELTHA